MDEARACLFVVEDCAGYDTQIPGEGTAMRRIDLTCSTCKDEGGMARDERGVWIRTECHDCGDSASQTVVNKRNDDELSHRTHGVNYDRCATSPREAAFQAQWAENCKNVYFMNNGRNTLQLLLGCEPSDRDYLVAATVIQWLGSNCGQCFLREAEERVPKHER